ncbi:MAG: FAD:protein FMN transferase [Bacteroidetes bacterium]|nr:MAG: FAD:protein FMN transferase [Bacteroidota bacterium]
MLKSSAQQHRFSFTEQKMGAPFTIVFYAADSVSANQLARQCYRKVDSFVLIFSDYVDSSELCRLSAAAGKGLGPIPVSQALLDILLLSKTAFEKSGGAFDITIGPLSRLWRAARKLKQFPTAASVEAARQLVGFNKLRIDSAGKTVLLPDSPVQFDLGGIAQGYIAQKIMDYLTGQEVTNALINASGDIVTSGPPPGLPGWTVGVNVPENEAALLAKKLLLHHKAVTTSGNFYQYMEHGGKKYSHIIDPRTGYGVTFQRNISVIANDGVTADWLATACSILPLQKAKKLVRQMHAALLISEVKRGKVVAKATKAFADYWK